jgi:hypothetical protein
VVLPEDLEQRLIRDDLRVEDDANGLGVAGPTGARFLVRGVRRRAALVAVVQTPGCCQNVFSSPQKQPSANSAICVPSGYGPPIGVPRTVWMPGVMIGSARPGSASSGEGIVSGLDWKNLMAAV